MKTAYEHTAKTWRFDIILASALTLLGWAQLVVAHIVGRTNTLPNGEPFGSAAGFHQGSIVVSVVLVTLCFLPLIWRRVRPLTVLIIVVVAQCATSLWTHDPLLTFIAPLIALYTVGTAISTRRLVLATLLVAIALVCVNHFAPIVKPGVVIEQLAANGMATPTPTPQDGDLAPSAPSDNSPSATPDEANSSRRIPPNFRPENSQRENPQPEISNFATGFFDLSRGSTFVGQLQILASLAAFAALGRMVRLHREYLAENKRREEESKRAHEEAALRRAEEERMRIARELHDITAHSLAAVVVQAGAAETLVESDPQAAVSSIRQMREVAKRSLDELRQIVGVLRDVSSAEDAPLSPEVNLSELDELLKSYIAAGVPVSYELRTKGRTLEEVPTAANIAIYRVVQESLTNVLRHAGSPEHVSVILEVEEHKLCALISDDGKSDLPVKATAATPTEQSATPSAQCASPALDGHGITGMRERVLALGGSFETNVRTDEDGRTSGFAVKAEVPL